LARPIKDIERDLVLETLAKTEDHHPALHPFAHGTGRRPASRQCGRCTAGYAKLPFAFEEP
jgi:hypothetical protein